MEVVDRYNDRGLWRRSLFSKYGKGCCLGFKRNSIRVQCGEGTSLGCLVCVLLGRYVMVYEHLFLGSCVGGRAKSR